MGIGDRGLVSDFICGLFLSIAGCIEFIALGVVVGFREDVGTLPSVLLLISFIISVISITLILKAGWGSAILMTLILLVIYALAGIAIFNFWMS